MVYSCGLTKDLYSLICKMVNIHVALDRIIYSVRE